MKKPTYQELLDTCDQLTTTAATAEKISVDLAKALVSERTAGFDMMRTLAAKIDNPDAREDVLTWANRLMPGVDQAEAHLIQLLEISKTRQAQLAGIKALIDQAKDSGEPPELPGSPG